MQVMFVTFLVFAMYMAPRHVVSLSAWASRSILVLTFMFVDKCHVSGYSN